MRCDEFSPFLPDVVDGEVPAARRAAIEAHLAECAGCRALVADLRRVQQAAATLERRPLPPGAWSRVAGRLRADEAFQRAQAASAPARAGYRASRAWLAVAAALALVVGGSLWLVLRDGASPATGRSPMIATSPPTDGNATPGQLVESVESELQLAAEHYEKAITGLEQVADATDSPLDPAVTATLRKNLEVIDGAIAESRVALRQQPGNRVAQESLFEAFRRKVALLQDTIALMNEMRKGNDAGAAAIVEGLKKS